MDLDNAISKNILYLCNIKEQGQSIYSESK
ncbi:hypothetical protein HMPREF1181_01566 [Bacteroides stercoris CC31F]|uniref:Uncharacterized protein n=1 Tax=Bacteroides stercoris CC31F TaxID=1073351 RepID=S3YFD4_BACSE|nr:hypothetical protein HMPREF1181_01566 [Bacteroides stercoris CC31F]SDW83049.1 hypothetical protein SAMN05444283_109102 [Bacteroides stercoris]